MSLWDVVYTIPTEEPSDGPFRTVCLLHAFYLFEVDGPGGHTDYWDFQPEQVQRDIVQLGGVLSGDSCEHCEELKQRYEL
jgi:hypothetical protein